MIRNREVRIRLAKTNDEADTSPVESVIPRIDRDDIILVKNFVKNAALFVGGVWLTGKVIDAGCEIIVHHGTKN